MKKPRLLTFVVIAMVVIFAANMFIEATRSPPAPAPALIDPTRLVPDWSAISGWPGVSESSDADVQANPDPRKLTTVILLDDSASMGGQMDAAKQAVLQAVSAFDPDSRVGILALNAGEVLPVMSARDAANVLSERLLPIQPNGATPLGRSLNSALATLTQEARNQRGFGVFRILVTTDGAASDEVNMNKMIARILSSTPVELATIGLGIGEGHALNLPGFTSYVSVDGVDGLANALQEAAAEQTEFKPITQFEE